MDLWNSISIRFMDLPLQEGQVVYSWTLDPVYTFPADKQTRLTSIPAGSLAYNTEYTVTCTGT